jgi:hypothetical protein
MKPKNNGFSIFLLKIFKGQKLKKRLHPSYKFCKKYTVHSNVCCYNTAMATQDSIALIWFVIDAFTHLTIEFGYLWLALTTTGRQKSLFHI